MLNYHRGTPILILSAGITSIQLTTSYKLTFCASNDIKSYRNVEEP